MATFRRPWTSSLALFVLVAFASTPVAPYAFGQGAARPASKRIGVVAIPARSADAQGAMLMQALFRSEVAKLEGGTLILPVGASDPADLDPARLLVDQGSSLLRANNFEEALKTFAQARALLDAHAGVPDRRLFARLYKGLAVARASTGALDAARADAQRSLLLWPTQADNEWAYNLETGRLYRSVKVDWETVPFAKLTVTSRPSRAEVYVDGVSRGFTPVTVEQLPAGPHHVLVAQDGFQVVQKWLDLKSEQAGTFSPKLTPIPGARLFQKAKSRFPRVASRPGSQIPLLESIADAHGKVDILLALTVRSSGGAFHLVGSRWSPGTPPKPIKETIKQDAYLLANVRGLVRSLFGLSFGTSAEGGALEPPVAAGVVTPDIPKDGAEDHYIKGGGGDIFEEGGREESTSIFSRWWFWTGAAVVVGGAVTAIVLLSGDDTAQQSPTGTLQIDFHTPSTP